MRNHRKAFIQFLTSAGLLIPACLSTTYMASTPSPPEAAPSEVELVHITNATVVYYDIFGSTEKELRDQMNTLGAVDYSGARGDAVTEWYIHWDWPGYGTSPCDL